jgi:MoxR-like ATPase
LEVDLGWLRAAFADDGYVCGLDVLLPVYLALRLGKPLLIEGAPGVGKTEVAKVLSRVLRAELIRLQCYEGLDENKALYEWNYQRQLLRIQLGKMSPDAAHLEAELERDLFSEEYLLSRPLLRAIRAPEQTVLLIDEVDKVDEAFEAFLFELLSDFQVSIPELGTIVAQRVPVVVLTSNSERDLSDGLKRRCVYLYIDFPDVEREVKIIAVKAPEVPERLAREVALAMRFLRAELELRKKPSIAETLDWARALATLGVERLNDRLAGDTATLFLKNRDDLHSFRREVEAHGLARLLEDGDAIPSPAAGRGAPALQPPGPPASSGTAGSSLDELPPPRTLPG